MYYKDGNAYKACTQFTDGASGFYTLEDEVTTDAYYPVVYTLSGNTSTVNTTYTADSLKAVVDALITANNLGLAKNNDETAAAGNATTVYTGSVDFNSNTNLADLLIDNLKITWDWAIERTTTEGSDEEKKAYTDMYNGADTILGNLMVMGNDITTGGVVKLEGSNYVALVKYTDYCLDTMFSIDITVTQVD